MQSQIHRPASAIHYYTIVSDTQPLLIVRIVPALGLGN